MKDGVRWHEDFGTGRRWRKRYSALLPVQYGDESDIKRVWELSRCQHFGALGIAHLITAGSYREHKDYSLENGNPGGVCHRDHREHRDCFRMLLVLHVLAVAVDVASGAEPLGAERRRAGSGGRRAAARVEAQVQGGRVAREA